VHFTQAWIGTPANGSSGSQMTLSEAAPYRVQASKHERDDGDNQPGLLPLGRRQIRLPCNPSTATRQCDSPTGPPQVGRGFGIVHTDLA
jgi:hypothetical protein